MLSSPLCLVMYRGAELVAIRTSRRKRFIGTRRVRSSAGRSGWGRPRDWRAAGRRDDRARTRSPSGSAHRRTNRESDSIPVPSLCHAGSLPDARLLTDYRETGISLDFQYVMFAWYIAVRENEFDMNHYSVSLGLECIYSLLLTKSSKFQRKSYFKLSFFRVYQSVINLSRPW